MKLQVVGKGKRRSGTSKKGTQYDGRSVHCIGQSEDVEGHTVEEVYFNYQSPVKFPEINVGDVINVSYDKNGFLEEVIVAEKSGK